jgi:hypothetical protein
MLLHEHKRQEAKREDAGNAGDDEQDGAWDRAPVLPRRRPAQGFTVKL